MSLELKIDELVEALNKNTAELKATNEGRESALARLEKAEEKGSEAPKRTRASTTKAAEDTKPAATPPKTEAKKPPLTEISDSALTESARSFLKSSKDDAEKEDRRAFVKAAITYFGGGDDAKLAEAVTETEQRHAVTAAFNTYAKGARFNTIGAYFGEEDIPTDEENNPVDDDDI